MDIRGNLSVAICGNKCICVVFCSYIANVINRHSIAGLNCHLRALFGINLTNVENITLKRTEFLTVQRLVINRDMGFLVAERGNRRPKSCAMRNINR